MKRKGADHEVEAATAKGDQLRIGGGDSRAIETLQKGERGVSAHELFDPGSALQPARQCATMRTEIEHHAKLTSDIVEPVEKAVSDFRMEEVDGADARRTIAVATPRAAVEQWDWLYRAHLGGDQSAE